MTATTRRPRSRLLAFCLSAALATLAAPAFAAAPAAVDLAYSEFTLPNGLRVIVHEDHKAPIVAVNLWYDVGSKDEKPGKTGFAHLYEHLMFEGSENHRTGYFGPFEKVGATDMNGTTNSDRTNFFENVPTTALDMALWMESDRMGHLLGGIGRAQLDQQRGVVENEKRQDENQPFGHVDDIMSAAMYPAAHPYHHTTIGSKADLDAATLDDVKTWFRDWYGPNNCVLVLAGDIDLATAKAKVTRYFGDIPASPSLPKAQPWIAPLSQPLRDTLLDHVARPRIYRAWNVPQFGSDDLARLQLFAQVLGGSKASRLDARLVFGDKLADHVSAAVYGNELGGQFIVSADVKEGADPARVEAIVDEELQRLLKDGPTTEEIVRAQTVYRASFVRGIERIGGFGGKADVLAQCAVFVGDPGCFRHRQEVLVNATAAQVQATAKQWLGPNDYRLLVKPAAAGQAPQKPADDSTKNDPYATKDRVVPAVDPRFHTIASDVDRSKGVPEVATFPKLAFPALQRATLSNGIKVVLAERHEIPVVQMQMVFGGGFASDPSAQPGLASFASGMHGQGAGRYDAIGYGVRQEELGAVIEASADLDTSAFSLSALDDQLDPSLDLFADSVLRPRFDAKDIERMRKTTVANIAQEKTEPTSLAMRLLPPLMYGAGHPYAIPVSGSGTENSVAAMTRADLTGWDRRWLRPDNATVIVVGDTTLADIVPRLERRFGDWSKPATPLPTVNIPTVALPAKPRVFLVDQPGAVQATIVAGQPVRSSIGLDIWNFLLANDVFGGQFSSRLNMDLREDKHWAYGSYSSASGAVGQQPWFAFAPVQIDKTAQAMARMHQDIDEYVTGKAPATAAELAKVKENEIRSLPGSYETGSGVLGQIAGMIAYHRPDNYVAIKPGIIAGVTLDTLQSAAKQIKPDSLTWVVVGDLKQTEVAVRALKFGEVSIIDTDGKPVVSKPVAAAPAAPLAK
ncbi:MAG: insulinase family protein [Proteobacteria bacterium]|nr:insulinase family protein [Pseudomonadota bacterium]